MQKFNLFSKSLNTPSTMKSLLSLFSSVPKPSNPNSVFFNYLMESFNFSESRALALSDKYPHVKSLDKPENVWQFFRNIGFSEAHIQSTVRASPEILVCDVNRNLKLKIEFYRIWVCWVLIWQILVDDKNNEYLIRTLRRCSSLISRDLKSVLLSNIEFFKSYAIVGSQLAMLLSSKPRLFVMPEFKLKELVSQLSDMGFSVNSRMFVHGLRSLNTLSEETFERKLELFKSLGFSRDEFIAMFRKAPMMLSMSEERLRLGLEFFLKKAELEKELFFIYPVCLQYSLENRVIPRHRVFKIVTSRSLLKKDCTFPTVLNLTEAKFLLQFLWRFGDDAEELLLAYKGPGLGALASSSPSAEE